MSKKILFTLIISFLLSQSIVNAQGLLGTYYNLSSGHPDMERWITGLDLGYVASTLSGNIPTLTAYGATRVSQWDWWHPMYQVFQRMDSQADLQSNFSGSWFPVNTGLPGDPQDFAVRWEGQFYVAENKSYTYSMGSDDDSWLFIDNQLVLDLGGVHGMTSNNYSISLNQGYHKIDIFFAERYVVESGFQLNFFTDLQPIPEPGSILLLGSGFLGIGIIGWLRRKTS